MRASKFTLARGTTISSVCPLLTKPISGGPRLHNQNSKTPSPAPKNDTQFSLHYCLEPDCASGKLWVSRHRTFRQTAVRCLCSEVSGAERNRSLKLQAPYVLSIYQRRSREFFVIT